MRDSRIAAIYEGTNGIHGIDLVTRKLPLEGGATAEREIAGIRAVADAVGSEGGAGFGETAKQLARAAAALDVVTSEVGGWLKRDPEAALAGASPYLRLFGLTLGGACLAKAGLAAEKLASQGNGGELWRVALARFYADKVLPAAGGLAEAIRSGAAPLKAYEAVLADSA